VIEITEELNEKIESVLFSSGRRMHVDELAKLCRTSVDNVTNALQGLQRHYEEKKSSLMLVEEGNMWKLTVREKYLPLVQKIVTETELPKSVIETLAVIAFKHPILQSELVKIRTNKAYDHVAELEEAGYITREKHGRTRKIKLTQKFFGYFDLPPEKMREAFAGFEVVEKAIEEKEKKLQKKDEKVPKLEVYSSAEQQPPKPAIAELPKAGPKLEPEETVILKEAEEERSQDLAEKVSNEETLEQAGEGTEETAEPVEEVIGMRRKPKLVLEMEENSEEAPRESILEEEEEVRPMRMTKASSPGVDVMDFFQSDAQKRQRKAKVQDDGASARQQEDSEGQKEEPMVGAPEADNKEQEKVIEKLIEKKANAIMNPPKEEEKPKTEEHSDVLDSVYEEIEEEKKELEKKTRDV
jgi:segregation and condensation protein B